MVACASTADKAVLDQSASLIDVYYGTDRNRREKNDPEKFYGPDRGNPEYGITRVVGADPNSKTKIADVQPLTREEYLAHLQSAVRRAKSPELLVFIHGYNRSFTQISKIVGELVLNTGFRGVPVIWSWPSSQNPAGYLEDETNLRWSRPHFAKFLRDLIEYSEADTVHLVGHSLGARALTDVMLHDLVPKGIDRSKIGEFILLAPDIDTEIFKRDLAPLLVEAGLDTTLYTSANDKALASARTLRGYSRVGDSRTGPVLIDGIETIDVTAANKSILGHSYFEESQLVSRDLAILLNERKTAAERPNLKKIDISNGFYWRLTLDEEI